TMFLYDLDTGAVHELAHAPHVNGQPVHGPNTPPVVSKNHVIWSESLAPIQQGNDASLQNAVVRIEDLTTGQVTTLATKAGQSNLSWPWACWGQITSGSGGYVEFKNLVTGQQEQLHSQPATIALNGSSVVYDDSVSVYFIDDITKGANNPATIVQANPAQEEHYEFVSLSDRLISWRQDDQQGTVWDRAQQRIVILPMTNPVQQPLSWSGQHILVWFDPETQAQQTYDAQHNFTPTPTIDVIDTTTLPTTAPGG
ncbi:MAG: hypothetical protein ABI068_00325, partial [Ktedonobacterales bacterium]